MGKAGLRGQGERSLRLKLEQRLKTLQGCFGSFFCIRRLRLKNLLILVKIFTMAKVEEAAVAYRNSNPLQKVNDRKTFAKVVPLHQWSSDQKIKVIKEGISKEELENLKRQSELDYNTLAKILGVTKATLHSKKGSARFDAYVSERILLLADVYSFGYTVFKEREKFNRWMKTPNRALGGIAPLSMAETVYGTDEVKNLIGRIYYGVYS